VLLGHDSLHQILDDFVHENSVVTFCGEACMSASQVLSEAAAGQKAHATTTFAAHSGSSRIVPAYKCLDN